jgi:hypothetical protein
MIERSNPAALIGYCTNVHAGATLDQTLANLRRYTLAVKQKVRPDEPMGVGLWLSNQAATELTDAGRCSDLAAWLNEKGLIPFTLNGFPYGNFHGPIVKYDVYEPDWSDERRLQYTINLANVHSRLVGSGREGSISTLPIGWPGLTDSRSGRISHAVTNLLTAADHLALIEDRTGAYIHLDIEPEPGCLLSTSQDVVKFFEEHLLQAGNEDRIRRHLQICHDVCHAAVMFEGQADVIERYRSAGLTVGKVQLSSAIAADLSRLGDPERQATIDQIRDVHEPRYLHQTVVRHGEMERFFCDLPDALNAWEAEQLNGEWRIHFHVPLYVEKFGLLESTQPQLLELLSLVRDGRLSVRQFEAETYAWDVLPDELKAESLADGIAREIHWLDDLWANETGKPS